MAAHASSSGAGNGLIARFGVPGLAGILLMIAAVIAFVMANSPAADALTSLLAVEARVGIGPLKIEKAVLLWVNDGLMAVFFLLVGLEVKRELLEGALSTPRRAALPVFAALGGLIVPAVIYTLVNMGAGGDPAGWAVPAATDIAFALGVLALLGNRVPVELKVFLTAVAVVDDLGAIVIIAAFFTDGVTIIPVVVAAGVLFALFIVNRAGIRHPVPYVVLGIALWVAVLKTGVHATIAGVLLAAFIPARRKWPTDEFVDRLKEVLAGGDLESRTLAPDNALHRVRQLCNNAESPMLQWEHALQPWVLFGIMPIFALANAGVSLNGVSEGLGPVGLGVLLGLFIGKPVGITLGAWLGVRFGPCEMPANLNWSMLHGAAWLGGIGFTMSLFIVGLALEGDSATSARIGLLAASVAAGIVGTIMILRATRSANPRPGTAPS